MAALNRGWEIGNDELIWLLVINEGKGMVVVERNSPASKSDKSPKTKAKLVFGLTQEPAEDALNSDVAGGYSDGFQLRIGRPQLHFRTVSVEPL